MNGQSESGRDDNADAPLGTGTTDASPAPSPHAREFADLRDEVNAAAAKGLSHHEIHAKILTPKRLAGLERLKRDLEKGE